GGTAARPRPPRPAADRGARRDARRRRPGRAAPCGRIAPRRAGGEDGRGGCPLPREPARRGRSDAAGGRPLALLDMAAVLLALAASASWGVSDFLGGVKARSLDVLAVLAVSQPAGLVLLGVIVGAHGGWPGWGWWALWAALGGLGGAIGIGALYRGLAVGSMGIVAPITSTSPLIPLTVGLARGERPSTLQLAGIALALVGVAFAGWEPGAEGAR